MTLDEAIAHTREVAKENREREKLAVQYNMPINKASCAECAKEHEQLAEWLTELKEWHKLKLICANEGVFVFKVKEDKENDK